MIELIPFAGVAIIGVTCIFLSWRFLTKFKPKIKAAVLAAGWAVLIALNYLLIQAYGVEVGLSYGLTLPSLIALVFVFLNRDMRDKKTLRAKAAGKIESEKTLIPSRWQNNAVLVILTCFYSGAVSLIAGVAISLMVPVHQVDQMVIALGVCLLTWALLAFWFLVSEVKIRLFFGSLLLSGLNLVLLLA